MSDREMAEVTAARTAARVRFAHFADDEGEDSGVVDPDNPLMTDADLARLRPAAEVSPALVTTSLRRKSSRSQPPLPVTSAPLVAEQLPRTAVSDLTRDVAEDVIQVVEERLEVGRRSVSRGKVRIHSYVIENQISEDVTLRHETVTVDRRVVDRPVAVLSADAFQERTIEMEEIDEEAVVAKSARIIEEISIRKDVSNRTETIRDIVRSTKVDIEDGRVAGATASFSLRLVKDMEVVGLDGVHVGIIDHVDDSTMKLKLMNPASSGQYHLLPTELIKSVSADGKALLSIVAADAMKRWDTV